MGSLLAEWALPGPSCGWTADAWCEWEEETEAEAIRKRTSEDVGLAVGGVCCQLRILRFPPVRPPDWGPEVSLAYAPRRASEADVRNNEVDIV